MLFSRCLRPLLGVVLALGLIFDVSAADSFWIRNDDRTFDQNNNWNPSGVPGSADNAIFTNNNGFTITWTKSVTNANAFFNGTNGVVTQAIGGFTWSLTNSYVVGQSNNTTSTVTHTSGTLRVTNAAGTARLVIGQDGKGAYNLDGGTVLADQLFVTNNGPGFTNSVFNFNYGSLTTLNGSVVTQATDFIIGNTAGQTASWLISGGTNNVALATGSDTLVGNVAGSRGVITVTGAGTLWSNSDSLFVGRSGASNQLTVTNGGRVTDAYGYVGFNTSSSNNLVFVTGAGSVWSNRFGLYVGRFGSSNTVVVSNSATVFAPNIISIGDDGAASNNVLTVQGGNLIVTNSAGTGRLTVGRDGEGTLNFNGGTIIADQLFVTNNGPGYTNSIFNFNSGTLTTFSNSTLNTPRIGGGWLMLGGTNVTPDTQISGFFSANVSVIGPSTVWNNESLKLGGPSLGGAGNLLLSNGANVKTGGNAQFEAGAAVVTGTNSLWSVGNSFSDSLTVGFTAIGFNRLDILSGGTVNSWGGVIGNTSGGNISSDNTVRIDGPGSQWNIFGTASIGIGGARNALVVTNGGRVTSTRGVLGITSTAVGNLAVVTGAGSVWTNSGSLSLGIDGGFSFLMVSNGGAVFSASAGVGSNVMSANNQVIVTGAGSVWSNQVNLVVGVAGSGNSLNVSSNGTVAAADITVGNFAGALNNVLTVQSGNLIVTNAAGTGALTVGQGGQGTLNFNGGTIVADQLLVTNGANSVFNFNAGTLNVRTTVVANTQTFLVGNGLSNATMNLVGAGGTHSFANGLTINTNAFLIGNGTIFGSATNHGTISLGSSPGAITIHGDLRLRSSSMLTFEIGGLIATNDYDQLNVTNFIEFAGTLSLSLLNNFLPGAGDSFTLFKYASASGAFNNVIANRVSLTNNLASFAVTATATDLVIGDAQYVDTDGDGQGDLQELAAGTDPNDSNNYLHVLAITQNGSGQNLILFQSVPAKIYRIEYSNDLVAWPVATTNVPSAGAATQWIDDGTLTGGLPGNQRFYRIGL